MSDLISLRLEREDRVKIRRFAEEQDSDSSALIRGMIKKGIRDMELERSLELYKKGRITLWKAARMAGLSFWEILEVVKDRKIEAQYTLEQLEEDFKP